MARTDDGLCYVVSKFIEGSDLAARLKRAPFSHRESAEIVATVSEALHYSHTRGLVHRDIKPANILLDTTGKPFVADFGLALRPEDFGRGPGFAGTPAYMSPEQAKGEGHRVDGRSDIFSLGVVFYELLTSRRPFSATSQRELLDLIATTEARPPRQIDDSIPKELERIDLKALSKRASERYTTARDMADDLRFFLQTAAGSSSPVAPVGVVSSPPGSTQEVTPQPITPKFSDSDQPVVKVIPKGLRSFDDDDADFFLELLPGPRNREGLPESIRFWKSRIESINSDKTFKVGLIYGPSGCGKSSLVKAGLLPRLAKHVLVVYVESTPEDTETRLHKGLRKVCPDLSTQLGLVESLMVIRQGRVLRAGQKVLLVIDQFEQWLHSHRGEENTELVAALRQCDGEHIQAMVMARDDFWLAACRFMAELELELIQGQNMALVDLFDKRHARKVLTSFGTAFGTIPEQASDISKDQETFLDQSITELAQDGKIISVRLALFAEMVKGKPWTPKTLREVGGTEGVGVTFLEETFASSQANPKHRLYQKAAQSVLKALLPESGSDIKGQMRSQAELRDASGYENRPRDFADLLHILDNELRLITPTDPEGSEDDKPSTPSAGHFYQLTHDYLVHSLRDWLTRKQRETRKGRAELRLAERSSLWNAKPENRFLPSPQEWATIRIHTKKKDWSEPQRRMMKRAGRVHGVRGLTLAVTLLLLALGGYEVNGRLQAERLRDKLLGSPLADTPRIIVDLKPYRRWVDHLLRESYSDAAKTGDNEKQLKAALGLLPVDDKQLPYLKDRLLHSDAKDISILRQSLAAHKNALVPDLWKVSEKPAGGEKNTYLQAASGLALYDPENPRWKTIATDLANRLVAENASVVASWIDAFFPVAKSLKEPLISVFHDQKRGESERTLAASALAEYFREEPDDLAKLLIDSTPKQFVVVYPIATMKSEQVAPILEAALSKKSPSIIYDRSTDQDPMLSADFYEKQANAIVALIRMRRGNKAWMHMKHSPDPTLRSYLVHRLGPLGVDGGSLMSKLEQESEVSIRRALILSLGEVPKGRISTAEQLVWTTKMVDLYRNDPDPGIHGATEWLLRRWGQERQIEEIDKELTKLPLPSFGVNQTKESSKVNRRHWYINSQGQTMVIVPDPVEFEIGEGNDRHQQAISHGFAIASKEVTVSQYETFLKTNPFASGNDNMYSPLPSCPMNSVSWYDAGTYCDWLSKQEGIAEKDWFYETNDQGRYGEGMKLKAETEKCKGYRLPTDAEWEYSCRAGASTDYSFGGTWELLDKYGWYNKNSNNRSYPVGSLKPNDLGLFDLHGNLYEWCNDAYDKPSVHENRRDPRVIRGGTFIDQLSFVRSALRLRSAPSNRGSNYGFRPSRTYP